MRVLLDIGAHTGQTLAAALRWNFDRIVCFEPISANALKLRKLADKRTTIAKFGLWNKTTEALLFHPGTQGASLWERPNRPVDREMCAFVRASDWLQENLKDDDQVWVKLNAEGAELDIITDLLDSGAIERLAFLLVMWDAHKIPAIAAQESVVRDRLTALYSAPRVMSSKNVPPASTHAGRIDNWLTVTGGVERL